MARKNKPQLRDPSLAHIHAFNEDMGITTARTVGKRTDDLAAEKIRGGKPITVTGTHADGTATVDLMQQLHEAGQIIDETTLGLSPPSPAPTDNPTFTGLITVLGIPTASPTYIQAGFFQVEEIDTDDYTHPATIDASPQATYPGAGFGPTGVSMSGGSIAGVISLTTGTGPLLGDVCHVTYGINRAATGRVVLQARTNSAATDVSKIKITGADLTGFTVTAVTALPAGQVYTWNYLTF